MESTAKFYAGFIFPVAEANSGPELAGLRMAMLDTSPDCIKLLTPEGRISMMNRAGRIALDVAEGARLGMEWLPRLSASVRAAGAEALAIAASGVSARFAGQSVSSAGTSFWDNLLTPLVDESGKVESILCISRDVTAHRLLERELEAAIERERLMAQEMRHRVKNVLTVVSGLISISEREAASGQTSPTSILRERVSALSRASDAVFTKCPNNEEPLSIADLVHAVLHPYAAQCESSGEEIGVQRHHHTTLALMLHELATNSIKYGALSQPAGIVSVSWEVQETLLILNWVEKGGPEIGATPDLDGFGSAMIDRVLVATGGAIKREWRTKGLTAEIRLPTC